jgi:hypothetical protein
LWGDGFQQEVIGYLRFIKEPWATPNRATPKSCYPFKQKKQQIVKNSKTTGLKKKNATNQSNKSKRNSKPVA